MKRILVIITTSMVPYGGLATVALNYYRNIDQTEYHMDFASTNVLPEILDVELKKNGSKYYQLPNRIHQLPTYISTLKKICGNYDVIHVHGNSATTAIELLAAKMADVSKRIVHIHNTHTDHILVHNLLKPFFNKLYTDAIACSKMAGEWIFSKYAVLNNAIELSKYSYNDTNRRMIRRKYGISDNDFVIGHVGKLVAQKNHTFLLDIFSSFRESMPSKLMIVGDGVLRNNIEEQAKNMNIEDDVIFCGMTSDASPYYSSFDCFVFPSLFEGLPLSVLEAQANGLKCVVSQTVTSEVDMGGTFRIPYRECCYLV